jgi:hypothetical protein
MDQAVPSIIDAPTSASSKSASLQVGVHGVRLKQFEQVLVNVLPSVKPEYVCLPPVPRNIREESASSSSSSETLWPFDSLPTSARVLGKNPGQLPKPERAARKEQQLQSMLRCILRLIPTNKRNDEKEPFTIVDFGGGSGHLGIPLALLFPNCRVVVVDLRKRSLDLMHQKAELVIQEILKKDDDSDSSAISYRSKVPPMSSYTGDDPAFLSCGRNDILENLLSFHGPVEKYSRSFDMALALHLCGEATDVTLRKAALDQATAIVVAPCCVGKLSRQVSNPYVFFATGQHMATVSYPQSPTFCQLISQQADWDALVKAADYSNEKESRTSRNATRRTAKALLETDRRLFLENTYNYRTALMRMDPWEATPKNDILVAWDPKKTDCRDVFSKSDKDCQTDLQVVISQLLDPSYSNKGGSSIPMDSSDWTGPEEQDIENQITEFLKRTEAMSNKMDEVLVFPTRMGGRKRKLIHFVARKFDLAHWSVGEKDSEKTVAIARRGQLKRKAAS